MVFGWKSTLHTLNFCASYTNSRFTVTETGRAAGPDCRTAIGLLLTNRGHDVRAVLHL